jgi:hypothetical protein
MGRGGVVVVRLLWMRCFDPGCSARCYTLTAVWYITLHYNLMLVADTQHWPVNLKTQHWGQVYPAIVGTRWLW